eukprot:scaffold223387_cov30-Tisochrysis_lutea.AAC.1
MECREATDSGLQRSRTPPRTPSSACLRGNAPAAPPSPPCRAHAHLVCAHGPSGGHRAQA